MIGIYQDKFKNYLEDNLGKVKVTARNLVTRCPWCEVGKNKKHFHLYISLDAPIFNCFYAGCSAKGTISKLVKKIEGVDNSERFIDKDKLKESIKKQIELKSSEKKTREIYLPELKEKLFNYKDLYLKGRIKFTNNVPTNKIKGLIYDINEFIRLNDIQLDEKINRIKDYIQANFIGFLSENKSVVILRNVDSKSSFRHYKLKVQASDYLDYYKLKGMNPISNHVVLSEGVFDIFNERIFDHLKLRNKVSFYACGLSESYDALLKSIVYHEDIFKIDIHILSDRDVGLERYKNIKKYNSHLINSMTIYYNRAGKDFADSPCVPEKFVI